MSSDKELVGTVRSSRAGLPAWQ